MLFFRVIIIIVKGKEEERKTHTHTTSLYIVSNTIPLYYSYYYIHIKEHAKSLLKVVAIVECGLVVFVVYVVVYVVGTSSYSILLKSIIVFSLE